MSLLSVEDLQRWLEADGPEGLQPLLDYAEQMVAAYLGADSLEQADFTETKTPVYDTKVVELANGPLTTLTSITANGVAIGTADVSRSYWLLGYKNGFAGGVELTIVGKRGWLRASAPYNLKQAIYMTAAAIKVRGVDRGAISTRLGDFAETYSEGELCVPESASRMVRSYRKVDNIGA